MLEPEWEHGAVRTVGRGGYALVHSSVDLIPLFVCEGITVAQITGPLPRPRSAPFAPDPLLPVGERSELVDYAHSGLDRGHMAPSADQTADATLQAETYFLSNMAPQVGVGFNQHAWARLESTVRDWLEVRGGGWIVTGPMFYDPAEEEPSTRDGIIPYSTIGPNNVAVPTHFYKIVVARSAGDAPEAIAFVFENRAVPSDEPLEDHIVSIDWIEARTGIDFMPELGVDVQQALEGSASELWE